MRLIRYTHASLHSIAGASLRWWFEVARRLFSGGSVGPNRRRPRPQIILVISLAFALVMQSVLVFVVWYLVDLSIDLMEVWAELAAKHLEITLDRTL